MEVVELNMALTDSVIYTTPWEADPVTFRTYPEGGYDIWWMKALVADRWVPEDEVFFNRTARDLAGGITSN